MLDARRRFYSNYAPGEKRKERETKKEEILAVSQVNSASWLCALSHSVGSLFDLDMYKLHSNRHTAIFVFRELPRGYLFEMDASSLHANCSLLPFFFFLFYYSLIRETMLHVLWKKRMCINTHKCFIQKKIFLIKWPNFFFFSFFYKLQLNKLPIFSVLLRCYFTRSLSNRQHKTRLQHSERARRKCLRGMYRETEKTASRTKLRNAVEKRGNGERNGKSDFRASQLCFGLFVSRLILIFKTDANSRTGIYRHRIYRGHCMPK